MKIAPIEKPATSQEPPVDSIPSPFALLRRLDTPIWIFDIDRARIIFANASACRLWSAKSEETLLHRNMGSDMSLTVEKRLKQYQLDFAKTDTAFNELWTLYPNGDPKSVMVTYRGYPLPDGRMAMLCEAVSETEDEPDNLRSAEALLHTDVMITLFGQDGAPLYLNPAARNASLAIDKKFETLFADPQDYQTFITQIDVLGECRLVTKVRTKFGPHWYDLSAKRCFDAVTGLPAVLLTAIDVSELKEARDTARHMADHDQLTNLHNRAFLQRHLALLAEQSEDSNCAVIFFDVDRFKIVNDQYGHDAGDTVLQSIAVRVRETMDARDLVVRLGGDEFVVILEGVDSCNGLRAKVAALRAAMSAPIAHGATSLDVTISIGVARFSPKSADFKDVLGEADIALYTSKQAGRDCATFYSAEMGAAAQARDQLEVELRHAVRKDEFILHYQPRLDIKSGKIIGAEGLVRWKHPTRGIIMPDEFITICEETGLIEDLGRLVLEVGCAQAIAWQRAGLDMCVSLNVSSRQFGDDSFMRILQNLASLPDFPTGKIELEITESLLIGDHMLVAEKLVAISEMGYQIAIDDFGTGYSNLSYILCFPLTCLKIDRSFIDQLPASGPIIQLILMLGKQIGVTIVSEGVETQEQLDWLTQCDCAQAQGYFIARPLSPDLFEAFVAQYQPEPQASP